MDVSKLLNMPLSVTEVTGDINIAKMLGKRFKTLYNRVDLDHVNCSGRRLKMDCSVSYTLNGL